MIMHANFSISHQPLWIIPEDTTIDEVIYDNLFIIESTEK